MTSRSTHKLKGYYSFIVTLFASPQDKGKTFHVNQSWLPLSDDANQLNLLFKYRAHDVFPALGERGYAVLASSLETTALTNQWISQSALVRVRPHAFDELQQAAQSQAENEEAAQSYETLTGILPLIRAQPVRERAVIEAHSQGESRVILEQVQDIFMEYLEKEGFELDEAKKNQPVRALIPMLIQRYPFLPYTLFRELPALTVFYYPVYIKGVKVVMAMIRSSQADILLDKDWLFADPIMDIKTD